MIRTNSARMAIAIATGQGWQAPDWDQIARLGCRIDRSGKGTNIPSILHNLDCGRVLAGMDANGPQVRDWLCLAYAADGYMDEHCPERVHEALMAEYVAHHGEADETHHRLGFIAMHQYRCHMRQLSTRLFKPGDIAKKLGVDHRRYSDTWEPKMALMFDILDRWDRRGLGAVSRMLRLRDEGSTTSCTSPAEMVAFS